MDKVKAFLSMWGQSVKENGRATVIERPFTSATLVGVGVGGTLLLQFIL